MKGMRKGVRGKASSPGKASAAARSNGLQPAGLKQWKWPPSQFRGHKSETGITGPNPGVGRPPLRKPRKGIQPWARGRVPPAFQARVLEPLSAVSSSL